MGGRGSARRSRTALEHCDAGRLRRVAGCCALALALAACGGGDGDTATPSPGAEQAPAGEIGPADLADLGATFADVESIDRRPALLADIGGPDAFVITVDEIDGTLSRFESWSYFAAGTQIDLVDGEVLWDIAIDPLPDGSLLPLMYDPMEFTMMASRDDTLRTLEGVDVRRIESDVDVEVDGTEVWAGEQLMLGFVDDHLVYVETFPLAPGEQEIAG